MYVRKKKNRSGSTSVVVVSKKSGRYEEVKSFGASTNPEEISRLYRQAKEWAHPKCGQLEIDFDDSKGREREETRRVIGNMASVLINGSQLLLNRIYDSIGFNRIPDEILRHLVIARVSQPASKLATVAYLKSYYDEDVDLSAIYRYMDRLYNTQMELAQQISVEHTRKILGGQLGIVFYDVTTLYFETSVTDALREPGFSKDGRMAESQVVLGLLVSEGGYPLSYSLYNGKQHEGFTMIPMIDDFKARFSLADDFVIVADSGLMSRKNVALLRQGGYKYIIGARIRNAAGQVKDWILSRRMDDGEACERRLPDGDRLILGYSEPQDRYCRRRTLTKLRLNGVSCKHAGDGSSTHGQPTKSDAGCFFCAVQSLYCTKSALFVTRPLPMNAQPSNSQSLQAQRKISLANAAPYFLPLILRRR